MNYNNTNTGLLSKNDRREKETHPEYKGQINVEGVDYWLSAWIRERKDGTGKFFSLSVTLKDKPKAAPTPRQAPRRDDRTGTGFDDMDSDGPPF